MSTIATTSIIDRWQKEGVSWDVINEPKRRAFQIPANSVTIVPTERHRFGGEGVLRDFSASFDSTLCGLKIKDGTNMDSRDSWIIRDFAAIQYPVSEDLGLYTVIPPYTPYGIYYIHRSKDWYWKKWLELSLINIDTVSHWVYGYGYQIALARNPDKKGNDTS